MDLNKAALEGQLKECQDNVAYFRREILREQSEILNVVSEGEVAEILIRLGDFQESEKIWSGRETNVHEAIQTKGWSKKPYVV